MDNTGVAGLNNGPETIDVPSPNKDAWGGIIVKKPSPEPEIEEESADEVEDPQEDQPSIDEISNDDTDEREVVDDPEEKEPNPYFYLSSKLKSDGFLLEDFEATEDVAGLDVYNAYRKKLEKELEPRIRQEVFNKLEHEGINESDLVVARAIRQGVDVNLLSTTTMHERYASLKPESHRDEKINAIKAMYVSRNFTEREIDNLMRIATDDDDDYLDEYFAESKQYHTAQWNNFKQQEHQRVLQENQEKEAQLQAAEALVNRVLSEKNVYGEVLSDEESSNLREAIYSPIDILELEGQSYSVSKLYKFNYLLQTDPELKLWLFKKYLFRNAEVDSVKKEVQKEMENDMLKAYEASVKKDKRLRDNKIVNEGLEKTRVQSVDAKTGKKTYYVEF